MYFDFFNVESIRVSTWTFVAICSATSYLFVLSSRSKRPPLDIIKLLVITLRNQDNKFAFIWVDEDGALARYSEFMKTCHNMNIIVKLYVEIHLISMVKLKVLMIHLLTSQDTFYWKQVTRKNLVVLPIIIPYGYHAKPRIYCVVMFLTYYGTEQDLHTNTSKYGGWESTSSMYALQEIILVVSHIEVITWDMKLL